MHSIFQQFNSNLQVTASKQKRMTTARLAIRDRIRNHFKEHHSEYTPSFYIQGSAKTSTMIRTKDNECDIDDGVWFLEQPKEKGTTLQRRVKQAVDGHTDFSAEHRKHCVRVRYAGEFHIDIPVLYKTHGMRHPKVAVKNEDWRDDDPKEFIEWLNKQKDKDGQLKRVLRYMKAWADHKAKKMPSGLIITVLSTTHFKSYAKDDVSLYHTLKNIKDCLRRNGIRCYLPTTPKDELFAKYSHEQKENFYAALCEFVKDAEQAIYTSPQKAHSIWKKQLGNHFPELN